MADAIAQISIAGELDEFFSRFNRSGKRLLAKDMFAGEQRIFCHCEVKRIGCADVDGVDTRVAQHVAIIGIECLDTVSGAEAFG